MRRIVALAFWLIAGACLLGVVSPQARQAFLRLILPGWERQNGDLAASAVLHSADREQVRVAVAAMISPAQTYTFYQDLFALVGRGFGRPVALVQKKTYREVNELLLTGEVEVAWICTGAWPSLAESGAAKLLVVPQVGGKTTYRSYLVVRAESPYRTLADLRGARIAYSDPLSLTGCRLPQRLLRQAGFAPEDFFAGSFYTHSHDNSLQAVGLGLADVAGVDSLVFDFLREVAPAQVQGLRVLMTSEELPSPPIVVSEHISPQKQEAWRQAFVHLHETAEGRQVLARLRIERFLPADPAAYQGLP